MTAPQDTAKRATDRPWTDVYSDGSGTCDESMGDGYGIVGAGDESVVFGGREFGTAVGFRKKADRDLVLMCVNGWDALKAENERLRKRLESSPFSGINTLHKTEDALKELVKAGSDFVDAKIGSGDFIIALVRAKESL